MQEANAVSPYMFIPRFTKSSFQKSSQWVALSRSAAYLAVYDRLIEPWFATFGGTKWRCSFIAEGEQVLAGAAALQAQGKVLSSRGAGAAALQLRRFGYLPANFSAGARVVLRSACPFADLCGGVMYVACRH